MTIRLLNTAVSFPIAFRKSIIYGAEGKLELPDLARSSPAFRVIPIPSATSGFPVTGGLFLGDDAANATSQLTGHFPDSQDQRNTVRGRLRYQVSAALLDRGRNQYDTGLPFRIRRRPGHGARSNTDSRSSIASTSPAAASSLHFFVDASAGADIYKSDRLNVRLQVDGENLTNVLNVHRFRRPLLRQRHRPSAQLCASTQRRPSRISCARDRRGRPWEVFAESIRPALAPLPVSGRSRR